MKLISKKEKIHLTERSINKKRKKIGIKKKLKKVQQIKVQIKRIYKQQVIRKRKSKNKNQKISLKMNLEERRHHKNLNKIKPKLLLTQRKSLRKLLQLRRVKKLNRMNNNKMKTFSHQKKIRRDKMRLTMKTHKQRNLALLSINPHSQQILTKIETSRHCNQ